MDGSEAEVEVIDLTLDDEDLDSTLPTQDNAAHADDEDLDSTLPTQDNAAHADDEDLDSTLPTQDNAAHVDDEPPHDNDDVYSAETLPAVHPPSIWRMETVRGLSRVKEEDGEEEEAPLIGVTHAGHGDVALPAEAAEAASCPSPLRAQRERLAAEPSLGAEVPGDEPLFPWIEPFVSRPATFQFDKGQVKVREIPGDGHCLFRAILHQRRPPALRRALPLPTDAQVEELRAEVAAFLRHNSEKYQQFFESENSLNDSITMVEQGGWGDSMSLSAIANMWKTPIEVYVEMGAVIRHHPEAQAQAQAAGSVTPLRLAFRCVEDADMIVFNHYDSVEAVTLDRSAELPEQARSASSPVPASPVRSMVPDSAQLDAAQPAAVKRKTLGPRGPRAFRGSAKRPCGRRGPTATSTPAAAAPSTLAAASTPVRSPSQDLVDPLSPSPALTPPGAPDDQCISASQETPRSKQMAAERSQRLSQSSDDSGNDRGRTSADLLTDTLDLQNLEPELTAVQKTSEWVCNISKVWDLDVDTVVSAFASSPEPGLHDSSRSEDSGQTEGETLPTLQVANAATCITTVEICETVVRTYSDCKTSSPRRISLKNKDTKTRTISTNVTLSNGKLVGTFQVFY